MSNFGDHPAGFFGVSGFYNGAATTSYRNIPGQTLTRDYGASPTSTKIMSFGGWIKRQKAGFYSNLLSGTLGGGGVAQGYIYVNESDIIAVQDLVAGGSTTFSYITNRKFRDVSSWYHLWVRIDTTDSTAGDRVQLWINGVRETSFSTATAPSENADTVALNQNKTHFFGHSNASYGGNVYYSDWYWLDGSSVSPVDTVGEFKGGVFIPKTYSGASFGNKGWHLKFDQVGVGSPSSSTIGADSSGNTNHWTSTANTNVEAHDCAMPDSPENNFCTLNPLYYLTASTHLSEGNLQLTHESTAHRANTGTMFSKTGKWYFEVRNKTDAAGSTIAIGVGLQDITKAITYATGADNYVFYSNNNNARFQVNTTATTLSTDGTYTPGAGDIIQVAFDVDSGKIFIGLNNTYIAEDGGNDGDPAGGNNPTKTLSTPYGSTGYLPFVGVYNNEATANFGQDDTFAGAISSAGNADGNGKGVFKYAPPSGFLALCSDNLPEVTIGPNSTTQATDYFNTVLYTGTGSSGNAINTVGFQTDWLWIKRRNGATSHRLIDSSRGVDKYLSSDTLNAEDDATGIFTSFDSNGFTVEGTANATNGNNNPYVAWNWKANGGTTVTNTAGDINTTVQANQTAGFSIVTWTGNGSGDQNLGHGLGATPTFVILKNREASDSSYDNWNVFSSVKGINRAIYLNSNAARQASTAFWGTDIDSTTFAVGGRAGNGAYTNDSNDYVAYMFVDIDGYSMFGQYVGNGDADGAFIYTGFRPAWVMIKNFEAANNWHINDSVRDVDNTVIEYVYADTNAVEDNLSGGGGLDFLSNGFKIRSTTAGVVNTDGGTYIFMAFAKAPFKYANAH